MLLSENFLRARYYTPKGVRWATKRGAEEEGEGGLSFPREMLFWCDDKARGEEEEEGQKTLCYGRHLAKKKEVCETSWQAWAAEVEKGGRQHSSIIPDT